MEQQEAAAAAAPGDEQSPSPTREMVSDAELIDHLRSFLRTSDLNTTTTAIVRRKLEEHFGVDLSERKSFIREQVDLFLQTQFEKPEEGEEEGEDEEAKARDGSDSEEEEEEEEDEEVSSNGKKKGKRVSKNKTKDKDVKKRGGGGFAKICSLSPELQKFVGVPEMARTEVVRSLWAYIREKDLQDPSNRKNIICDEALRAIFHVDTINMFQMNKALSKHIWPLESDNAAPATSTPKEKKRKQEKHEDSDEQQPKEKRKRGAGSGFLAPLPLSDALTKFIGTGENILPRSAVIKRIWDYIKENNLQDPMDKKTIICDNGLKELFGVDSFVGFTVSKLLKDHFIKAEQ